MKPKNLLKALPIAAVAAAISLAPAGNANAEAYAYSFNHIFGLTIVPTVPFTINSFAANSEASATLNGFGPATQDNTGPIYDTPPAQVGIALPNNTFGSQAPGFPGVLPGFNFARGDAVIDSLQVGGDPSTAARSVAEANVVGGSTGGGSAGNDSSTQFTFTVTDPAQVITFSLNADPLLRVATTLPGESAQSSLFASISIFTGSSGGAPVFLWSPDGSGPGATFGGTETADPFSLNTAITQLVPGFSVYDEGQGAFGAFTNTLAPGTYRLILAMGDRVDVASQIAVVPEPGTLALLGLALAGLGFGHRRRKLAGG